MDTLKVVDKKLHPVLTITAEKPQRMLLSEQLVANGDITAWQEAIVGASLSGLRLSDVCVDIGDTVQKGQVLAIFDTSMIESEKAQALAKLNEVRAELEEAVSNSDRALKLARSGALSRQEINKYVTTEKTIRARVAAARAALAIQDLRVKYTRILAPDSGIISARNATIGAVVVAGTELFRLVRNGRLEWHAEITAEDLARLKPLLRARITLPGGSEIEGILRQIAPTIDPKTRYAIAYVDLLNSTTARAGMFVSGSFELNKKDALTVPQEAIVIRDGFTHILRIVQDGRVALTRIQTGRLTGNRIEILQGVADDELIAISGAAFLNDGDLVQVVSTETTTTAKINEKTF
jgi:RND family efflux transporter MFP subunit